MPRLLLLGFGLDSLSLAKAYQDMHEMLRDPRRKTHCFRAIRMLYELYLREACPCPHRRSPRPPALLLPRTPALLRGRRPPPSWSRRRVRYGVRDAACPISTG